MFYAILFWLSFVFFIILGGYDYYRPSPTRRWTQAGTIFLLIMLGLLGYKIFGEGLKG